MDSALELRISVDNHSGLSLGETNQKLQDSPLIQRLVGQFTPQPFFSIWRLLALAEIPFSETLDYTKNVLSYVSSHLATEEGFSYTGNSNDIVPCYNAMLLEAYSRLGLGESFEAQRALNWIKHYQVFDRIEKTTWTGKGIQLHGGCFKSVPCYIGVVKTVRALLYYRECSQRKDEIVDELIEKGCNTILEQHF